MKLSDIQAQLGHMFNTGGHPKAFPLLKSLFDHNLIAFKNSVLYLDINVNGIIELGSSSEVISLLSQVLDINIAHLWYFFLTEQARQKRLGTFVDSVDISLKPVEPVHYPKHIIEAYNRHR